LRFDFRGADDLLYRHSLRNLSSIQNLLPKYVFNNRTNYFARGHLVANAYFPFASQNKATFFYHNAAPQWQLFNAGLWLDVENTIRTIARNAQVTVGVHVI
jgi:DNA/RNA endonuclease G (NUC1)